MKLTLLAAAASFAFATAALAAASPTPQRIRGHVVSVSATTLIVHTNAGGTATVLLDGQTKYVAATPATRADVQPGKFIGTATKTVKGEQVALELVIFSESMRGAGEGHYAWDNITDTTTTGAANVPSGMTNGNVTAAMPMRATHSSMTNGSVQTATSLPGAVTASGDKQLVVSYKGGTQTILLPPTAPVIAVALSESSVITVGAQVFVVAIPDKTGLDAAAIIVATHGAKLAM